MTSNPLLAIARKIPLPFGRFRPNWATIRIGKNPRRIYYSYMVLLSCLTSAELSAYDMFKFISEMRHRGGISEAFSRVNLLVKKWNYKAHDACKTVSNIVEKGEFRDFLARFSQSISVGMNMRDFLTVESTKYMLTFDNAYSRTTDKLKQVAETFSAILTSVSFLSISMLISNMVFGLEDSQTMLLMTALAITTTLFILDFFIYITAPKEGIMHHLNQKPFGLERLRELNSPFCISVILLGFSIPPLILTDPTMANELSIVIALPFTFLGIPLFLFGRHARRKLNLVKEYEDQFPAFVRNLGDAITSTSSVKEGIRILSSSDYGLLSGPVRRLDRRLNAEMGTEVGWKLFVEECGSHMVHDHMHAFNDSLSLGAKAIKAADSVFNSVVRTQSRRKKRGVVSGFLRAVAMPLQMTFTAVLVLIHALVSLFGEFANQAGQYLTMLTTTDPTLISYYVYSIIAATSFGTALAIHFLEGESPFSLPYYLGIQMFTTGLMALAVGFGADALLSQFMVVPDGIEVVG